MTTVYQRSSAYTFFVGALLMFPTISVIYLIVTTGEFYVFGATALFIVYLFMSFHFGIKFDEKNNQFISYIGYKYLYKTKSIIKISEILSFNKTYIKIKSLYDFVYISYNTSSRTCSIELILNDNRRITLVSGTERGVSKVVEILNNHLNKNQENKQDN